MTRYIVMFAIIIAFGIGMAILEGCISARPAAYEADLVVCNQRATTLRESIDCENDVRARYGRPPRLVADGGAP